MKKICPICNGSGEGEMQVDELGLPYYDDCKKCKGTKEIDEEDDYIEF